MITKITKELIDKWGACNREYGEVYSDENLMILSNGKDYLTSLEIAYHKKIPIIDKIFILLRPGVLGKRFMEPVNNAVKRANINVDYVAVVAAYDTAACAAEAVAKAVAEAASVTAYTAYADVSEAAVEAVAKAAYTAYADVSEAAVEAAVEAVAEAVAKAVAKAAYTAYADVYDNAYADERQKQLNDILKILEEK